MFAARMAKTWTYVYLLGDDMDRAVASAERAAEMAEKAEKKAAEYLNRSLLLEMELKETKSELAVVKKELASQKSN